MALVLRLTLLTWAQAQCLKNYGSSKLRNAEESLTFCTEHAGRTCCMSSDLTPIRAQLAYMRKETHPTVSQSCMHFSSNVLCSKCDADVGTGKSTGLCEDYCSRWFMACYDDFLDPYVDVTERLPFCTPDSLICSPIKEAVKTPAQFCEAMGYKVGEDKCYDGESRQIKELGKIERVISF